jgi:2,5-diamino-6-(ribosylamino)-4(3H)-pyrimidinone 5'-phosphate reductase
MIRPYIISHMMSSVDGRIDCGMTEKLPGVEEYYAALDSLSAPVRISGRVTAGMEMAEGKYERSGSSSPYGKEGWSKNCESSGCDVIIDTKGTLRWGESERPLIIVMSEDADKEYLEYLDERNISWIVTGKGKVDLPRAMEILHDAFGVERAAVVGGGRINAAFLSAGLLDEVSILIGSGIDGREGEPSVFDGLGKESHVVPLTLRSVQSFESGAVWIRYGVR